MLRFHCTANWPEGHVFVRWATSTRRFVPEVEAAIEYAWDHALRRPGVHLFDGPMCRLESWTAGDDCLDLVLSPTSYRIFLGTNMSHPELTERFGADVMANPVGLSPALLSADGHLLMGRRNASVAYYPNRVHPFAGAMEPTDADPFAGVRRELREELSFTPQDIAEIRCLGMTEDLRLRQPEPIFAVTSTLTLAEIESRLDRTEHHAIWAVPATQAGVESGLVHHEQLTPVGVAALLLWGRVTFGDKWFDAAVEETTAARD